jgi:hypothetical protein
MKRWLKLRVFAVLLYAPIGFSSVGAQTLVEEAPEQFPSAPHREETFYFCSACHNFKLIAAQGMSRDKWSETMDWMTVKHSMPKIEPDEREKIIDYLAAAFPAGAQIQRGGWKNPFSN